MTVNHACLDTTTNSKFTLDRAAFATHLHLDGDDTRYGLYAFGSGRGRQISTATKRALTCEAITPADDAQLHVFPGEGTSVAITIREQPPTPTQLHARAAAGLPCYRHVGDIRDWPSLKPEHPDDTFTGTCETIEQVLAAANELLAALATLQLGEAHATSLLAQPLRVLTYNHRGRLSTHTSSVPDLAEHDAEQTIDLWPLLIQTLETGEAAEDWDGERQRTLLLRTGGATALARELIAARARLINDVSFAVCVMPDPNGGFSRHLP